MTVLQPLLREAGLFDISRDASERAVLDRVIRQQSSKGDIGKIIRAAEVLESEALVNEGARETLFQQSFPLWSDLAGVKECPDHLLGEGRVSSDLYVAFRIAVSGTLARRSTEVRQTLSGFKLSAANAHQQAWGATVLNDALLSVVLLTRKGGGWEDIDIALNLMRSLRDRQTHFEEEYLNNADNVSTAVVELVALYHMAQMVTLAGDYVEKGQGAARGILVRLDTHLSQAKEAILAIQDGQLLRIARLLHAHLRSLVQHSIWNQVEGLGEGVSTLVSEMANRSNANPTLELWPSQEDAMSNNFLDVYRRAVVVQMPTSAGKTLLAKFSIVQTFALNRTATIAYIVPTRTLVNQITDELRADLAPLGMTVEQAIPVFELDPTEDKLLASAPSVLVTTAEKLDLLVRTNHAAVKNLSLVVVDEAHNLSDSSRGARLELVLATIQRDRPGARYLLLSPFVPNSEELAAWLGAGRELKPIRVEWQPNKRVVGALEVETRGKTHNLMLVTADAVNQSNLPAGRQIELGRVTPKPNSLKKISVAATSKFGEENRTLIVCTGKSYATERAIEVAAGRPERTLSDFGEAVIRHTHAELGENNLLAQALRRGVAYHHAGVSHETRKFIEVLMRRGDINTICGTTTLAQGVNFPITNVIIEGLQKGKGDELSVAEFWNIAGRAGRGMMSDVGVVTYPILKDEQRQKWAKFFQREAGEVASQLSEVVERADRIGTSFTRGSLRETKALSEFLQYLAHAFRVSGSMQAANEVEDLLRSSLIFHQIQTKSAEGADRLVRLCRNYLNEVHGQSGIVSLADGTGFATPTIRGMLEEVKQYPGIRDQSSWDPAILFGENSGPLTDRITLIANAPEVSLSDDTGGPFNPEKVARIVRDWVNGVPVHQMADEYQADIAKVTSRQARFASHLYSRLSGLTSWGMGALQAVALAGSQEKLNSHIPSMIYYGVNRPEAVWLRMAGLTREAASGAAQLWIDQKLPEPESFEALRSWISNLSVPDWTEALEHTPIEAQDMRLLWNELHN